MIDARVAHPTGASTQGSFVVQLMQGVVPQLPGPFAPQKPTHSFCLLVQEGVGPVQSNVAPVEHGVPSPQVHAMSAPAGPHPGSVVVVAVVGVTVVVVGAAVVVVGGAVVVVGVAHSPWSQTSSSSQAEAQVPLTQVRHWLASHATPHAPQLFESVFRSTHVGVVPQSVFAPPGQQRPNKALPFLTDGFTQLR
jgi:hypothetical protein